MAKFNSPLDQLNEIPAQPAQSRSRRRTFTQPTDTLAQADVRTASGSSGRSKAGQYQRKTITLPQEQIDYVAELAQANGMSALAFYRWLVDFGLQAYEAGDRPVVEVQQVRGEAIRSHWSSNS